LARLRAQKQNYTCRLRAPQARGAGTEMPRARKLFAELEVAELLGG